jgi:glycosyltransferase involved in cell wall biosynthesis
MISVIIPAHNEAKVIERCLRAILESAKPGEVEVVVVPNGCNDGTAAAARRMGGPVRVLETEIASKSHALNLGDGAATGFPRFYLDADVVLGTEALRKVAGALRSGSLLAAAPRMRVNLKGTPWLVRAYYEVWTRLPYVSKGMIGSGVYALSEEGRKRFGSFPDIISDDGYVHLHFKPHERGTVKDCDFELTPPGNFRSLVGIKTRSQYGKYQLHRAYPELVGNDPRDYKESLRTFLRMPKLWPCIPVYCLVLFLARARSLFRYLAGRRRVWDRDESSRTA